MAPDTAQDTLAASAMAASQESAGTPTSRSMPEPTTRVRVSDKDQLDVWVAGEGAPVVLIHGAMTRDLLKPLMDELVKKDRYQVIHYGRRGHGGHGLPGETADIPGQVADVVAVLDALGVDKAHVAGHSFGAYIALEMATQAAGRLLSAVLLEPPLAQAQTEAVQQALKQLAEVAMPLVVDKYTSGDADGAVTAFLDFTSDVQDAVELIEPALPEGARALAAADLNTWLQADLPAMGSWTADPAAVTQLTTPIVWIGGAESPPLFADSRALVQEWRPAMKAATIVGAGHYFPVLRPAETATALDELLRSQAP
ncbi:MAG TPA: alpha/beta hydrolase [Actinomycetes bacterium]|nr:alpha/beta hydrolase [Actinomycetes bacterium]